MISQYSFIRCITIIEIEKIHHGNGQFLEIILFALFSKIQKWQNTLYFPLKTVIQTTHSQMYVHDYR